MKSAAILALLPLAMATPLLQQRGACTTPQGSGSCMSTSSCSSGGKGSSVAGYCPGPTDIQCCVASSDSSSSAAPVSDASSGEGIVDAAEKEKGTPYVYGGGGVNGPTKGGFDCSGLTQYSVHKALGKTIPRTAMTQYTSGQGHRIPRSQAKAGDLIFWATNGDCSNAVEHVGIFIKPGLMINAATTGTVVREQSIWTSSGGLDICPDAVRFW